MTHQARHRRPRPQRRRALVGAAGVCSLLAAAAAFVVYQPVPPAPVAASTTPSLSAVAPSPEAPAATSAPEPTTGRVRSCRPVRLAIPALGVEAPVTSIGLEEDGTLGAPSETDRDMAGWYPSVLAGSSRGTVLMDAHTYRDGSAVFTPESAARARPGLSVRLTCPDGRVVAYELTEVHADLTPETYPGFVTGRSLYSTDGPAQVALVTCAGWSPTRRVWQNRVVLIGTPVA